MADPTKNQETTSDNIPPNWQRKHYNIQRVIAYGGLFGLLVLSLQWCEMRKSTNASTKAAKAAEDSVTKSTENAHLDQRAWVSAKITKVGLPTEGKEFVVEVDIKNTGRTFARKVNINGEFKIGPIDADPPFTYDDNEAVKNILLAPNGDYTFTLTTKQPWDSMRDNKVKFGPNKMLLHGYVTYYDIFDCVHWTIFCFILDPKKGEWPVYSKHNEADNDRCNDVQ